MFVVNDTAKNEADAIAADVDAGSGAGIALIYDDNGAGVPADGDAALTTQVLLATCTLNDPAFAAAIDASPGATIVLDVTPQPTGTAVATGTATFARLADSDTNAVVQMTVSDTGGGGELQLNSDDPQAGATVIITAGTITVPES